MYVFCGVLGTVGPVVPQEFNANLSLVTLSLGFNTDIFNSVSWSLDNLQDVDFPKRDRVGVMEVDRLALKLTLVKLADSH